MQYAKNILETIGDIPLVQLTRLTTGIRCKVLVKAEFMNPGGSIKDRIGIRMLEEAERTGKIKKGGTIIEPTSGNTGVGLAQAACLKGYRCIFVMPDKMSQEKIRLLKAYGAEVVVTPTNVEKDSPESYYSVADRLAREIPNAYQPNQYYNPVNPQTHYEWTGPEIWRQTQGKIDVFVAGMGTGGTISGCAKYLKEQNPDITIVGIDSEGSLYTSDEVRPYKVEGIGEDFIPGTIDLDIIDHMITVSDKDSFQTARRMARQEGILTGGSCGAAVFGALQYARKLDESKTMVVILPDGGRPYLSKFYSDEYMKENGFWEPATEELTISDLLESRGEKGELISVHRDTCIKEAVNIMHTQGVSQLPVMKENECIGSLHEAEVMNTLFENLHNLEQPISTIMGEPLPVMTDKTPLNGVFQLLSQGKPAVLVCDSSSKPYTIITKIDLIEHFSHL